MSFLKGLTKDDSIQEDGDYLGGGSRVLDTDVYDFTIDIAYLDTSKGGANSINFTFLNKEGKQLKQTLWVTSGTTKGCLNYYIDRNGKKRYLPGFTTADNIALLATGKDLASLSTQEKHIKVYNPDLNKEAPTPKQVIMDLVGKNITLGVVKNIRDKNIKNDSGEYVPSGETREENEIDKVFRYKDKLTVTEIKAESTEPNFYNKWKEKNQGEVFDKSSGSSPQTSTTAPTPDSKPRTSVFG